MYRAICIEKSLEAYEIYKELPRITKVSEVLSVVCTWKNIFNDYN